MVNLGECIPDIYGVDDVNLPPPLFVILFSFSGVSDDLWNDLLISEESCGWTFVLKLPRIRWVKAWLPLPPPKTVADWSVAPVAPPFWGLFFLLRWNSTESMQSGSLGMLLNVFF